ncbi:uncharacterized protein LOC135712734 [Ochlerotatus camptorhynchus]|uniref:uncharacterized protein LOC135712734 n=1 Tax=Ochlerotatus camptorhynchus TaxID=644619 RepID=UPI0031D27C16
MESEVKEEPPFEIVFQDVEEPDINSFGAGTSRHRKRQLPQNVDASFRLPDVTSSSIEAMHFMLRQWGLEALEERFDEHLIDINVLDYILDVDIVELCRNLPIRYRLVLRRNIQNKYYKRNIVAASQSKSKAKRSRQTIITFTKDPTETPLDSSEKGNTQAQNSFEDTPPTHFVSVDSAQLDDHDSDGTESGQEDESIRSILVKDPRFRPVLALLDQELVPDSAGLCHMNRLLTKHFFEERIMIEKRYPKKQEKHDLALKILEAFPHLERTRVNSDAPKESYFFWVTGGKGKGPHTGLIETRTSNMRKEVPPEERRYQRRKETVNYILSDSIRECATEIASLAPLPQNEETIANGMAECIDLHSCILQQGESNPIETLLGTFPHLLAYGGKMILQVFQRLHTFYNSSADLDNFLRVGLLLDASSFCSVENKYIKGALRMMKKLVMNGKKEEADDMSSDEAEASPLIRWLKRKENELDVAVVQRHISERSYLAPHIVCIADVFKEGNLFVVFQGKFIPCGKSATHALDVFFKMFAVFGIPVPVLLRKIHELMMVHLWKISNSCKSITVTRLISRLKEIDEASDECGYTYDST